MLYMAVRKEKDKRTWEYEYRITDPITGKVTHRHRRGYATKRDAEEALNAARAKEKHTATTGLTLRDVCNLYINNRDISAGTASSYRHSMERLDKIDTTILDTSYGDITPDRMLMMRQAIADTDYATMTKNGIIILLRCACSYVSDLYGVSDVARPAKRFRQTVEEELSVWDHVTWTPPQFAEFYDHVSTPLAQSLFKMIYWSGCRKGEALALKSEDLRPDTHSIYIHASRDEQGEHRPKSRASIRVIPLDDDTWADVAAVAAQRQPGEYLWPFDPTYVNQIMRTAITSAGDLPYLTVHGLRHSHATLLINSGANIVSVSHRLGHSSVEQTLRTYTHLMDNTDDQTMIILTNAHHTTNS